MMPISEQNTSLQKENKFMLSKEIENEALKTEKMRNALTMIAEEVQRFQNGIENYTNAHKTDIILKKLSRLRQSVKKKSSTIKKLKSNITTAHTVAKSFLSSTNYVTLNHHLQKASSEAAMLSTDHGLKDNLLQNLTIEVRLIHQKLSILAEIIKTSYRELQKIQNEQYQELPLTLQLKKIILCCGQYYADYRNEHDRCVQLEQKNRFLTNKISILVNNLETSSEELNMLRHNNTMRVRKEKLSKNNEIVKLNKKPKADSSDHKKICVNGVTGFRELSPKLDLSAHFGMVRSLLNDQSMLLQDLRSLADEVNGDF